MNTDPLIDSPYNLSYLHDEINGALNFEIPDNVYPIIDRCFSDFWNMEEFKSFIGIDLEKYMYQYLREHNIRYSRKKVNLITFGILLYLKKYHIVRTDSDDPDEMDIYPLPKGLEDALDGKYRFSDEEYKEVFGKTREAHLRELEDWMATTKKEEINEKVEDLSLDELGDY